jgi:hypothetical protein
MYTSVVAGSLIAALSLAAVPLHGQRVAANVVIRSGPVAGHVVVADGYSTYRRPVVIYRRAPARVIVVERVARRHPGHVRDWRKRGYRPVTLWYHDGRYYDQPVRGWRTMREVVVYERSGRFYQDQDELDRWNR